MALVDHFLYFVLMLSFLIFWHLFYYIKSKFGEMLALRSRKGLLLMSYQVSHSSLTDTLMDVLQAFYRRLIIISIQFYWLLLLGSVLGFLL